MKKLLNSIFGKKIKSHDIKSHEEVKIAQRLNTSSPTSVSSTGLDFSGVDSLEKAQLLYQEGKLLKLLLMPVEIGGDDVPINTVYVPPGILEIQKKIIGTIVKFAQDGFIDNIDTSVEYKGDSIVPSKINIKTTHSVKDGQFNPSIKIW